MSLKNEEESNVVEEVVGKRINNGKWRGWGPEENTWEPEEHLDCAKLIKTYEDEQVKKSRERAAIAKVRARKLKIKFKPSLAKARTVVTRKSAAYRRQQSAASPASTRTSLASTRASSTSTAATPAVAVKTSRSARTSKGPMASPKGFARGLQVERIIGVKEINNETRYLIKWVGAEQPDLVPAKEANIKCPQFVIQFYDDRLTSDETGDEESFDE